MPKQPQELPDEMLYSKLLDFYSIQYPRNPDGMLRLHIERKVKEGRTEHEAIVFLSRQVLKDLPGIPEDPVQPQMGKKFYLWHARASWCHCRVSASRR